MKTILRALIVTCLTSPWLMDASVGCLVSCGNLREVDYKEWRIAQHCTCDCEKSHKILPGGLCDGCKHRHTYIPINAHRNTIDMQEVVEKINLKQLARVRNKR